MRKPTWLGYCPACPWDADHMGLLTLFQGYRGVSLLLILFIHLFHTHNDIFLMSRVLPKWCSGNESTCQCRRCKSCGYNPWVGKIPCRRKWQPTPAFLPGKFHGQRSLVGYSPWGVKESDMTEHSTAEYWHLMKFNLWMFHGQCFWCIAYSTVFDYKNTSFVWLTKINKVQPY